MITFLESRTKQDNPHETNRIALQRKAVGVLNDLCKCLEEGSQICTIDNAVVCCHIHLDKIGSIILLRDYYNAYCKI